MGHRPRNIFIDPGTLERGGVCIVKRFRRTLALLVVYCRADARERENGIMRSAANRHRQLRCNILHKSAYFHSCVRRFVGRVIFGLLGGADTTQPPL
jgi:hypothetical protein